MATTSDDGSGAAWLREMVLAVRQAANGASDVAAFGEAVTDALADVEPNQFVWLGTLDAGQNRISVRSTSGEETPTAALRLDPDDSEQTANAVADGEVVVLSDLATSPAYAALREHVAVPPAEAGVSIPVSAGAGATEGVVHLYTDVELPEPVLGELATVLGSAIDEATRSVVRAGELSRERRRIEELRRTLSHDFGNPLNLATGRLELVAQECESRHVEYVQKGLDRIDALTSECHAFVEAGQPLERRESRSVAVMARSCWEPIETGGSTLETSEVSVHGEPERLSVLLTELLTNAIQHTDGPVTVTVGPLDDERGFAVADTGDGVPADEREFVFDRGYSTDADRDGNGLAIAREIADVHGWQLRLADATEGARFEVVTDPWSTT